MDKLEPALFILFGTTGDLAKKKLFPALYTLFESGWLAPETRVLGIGRRDWSDDYYRDVILNAVRASQPITGEVAADFLNIFSYYQLDMTDKSAYEDLWRTTDHMEKKIGFANNRIYFLSTAPDLFPVISEAIGKGQPNGQKGFRRLMIEKPFGHDLDSARIFNDHLRLYFEEQEIFRIDHYLGKEMLQNILVLRFANQLFEPAWRKEYIDHIQVTISEKIGIDQRGGYYDKSGALRDMVQNHILQLIALLTMDKPDKFDSEGIRDAKVNVLRQIKLFDPDTINDYVVLGQYAQGEDGQSAYIEEKGVAEDSETETFAAIRFTMESSRWQNVPIFIRTGKRMKDRVAKITVVYKEQPYIPAGGTVQQNVLIIRIQPREGVDLRYNIKKPGTVLEVIPVEMNFCQTCQFPGQSAEAYVKLIMDAWQGDLNLFARWDEIEATWTLIDSIQSNREQINLQTYATGENGPASADALIKRAGYEWLDL